MRFHIHQHLRKRRSHGLEPYPASSITLRMLDRVIYIVGIFGPLMTIPQLVKIYYLHDAAGVSAFTWGAYALLDLPWILYGMLHREHAITISYMLWFFFNGSVFVGAMLFGTQPF